MGLLEAPIGAREVGFVIQKIFIFSYGGSVLILGITQLITARKTTQKIVRDIEAWLNEKQKQTALEYNEQILMEVMAVMVKQNIEKYIYFMLVGYSLLLVPFGVYTVCVGFDEIIYFAVAVYIIQRSRLKILMYQCEL